MDDLFLENYLNMTSQEIDIDQLSSTLLGVPDSILPSDKEIPNTPVELQKLVDTTGSYEARSQQE